MLGLRISIHAPLAGRDAGLFKVKCFNDHFNPRAPCGARRPERRRNDRKYKFQSTRPLRGATRWRSLSGWSIGFQSTRPLRGATAQAMGQYLSILHFNPRAPCGARQQKCTNCFAHFCDNRQVLSKFAQNAACQGILIPFPFGKSLQIWVRTARAISARLRFAL